MERGTFTLQPLNIVFHLYGLLNLGFNRSCGFTYTILRRNYLPA